MKNPPYNVALVYDRVNKWGGAERVLRTLEELFPDAPLYTSVYAVKEASWAKGFQVIPSFLQHIPFFWKRHEAIPYLMPLAFEQFSFDKYDVVISLTSEAAKGILTTPNTYHICYCLTPTRYLWSGYNDYFNNPLLRLVTKPIVWYLRTWDRIAAQRPDIMVGISKEVQKRIKQYYKRDALVIYPPVSLQQTSTYIPPIQNYFLVVGRLVSYKRFDLAVKACTNLNLPLVVIGSGKEEKKLRKYAGATITFVKNLTDDELVGYYKHCNALLFPGIEDFGLVMVEAQQAGKPVLAFRGGAAEEIIVEGKTGQFFDKQDVASLERILKEFQVAAYTSSDCRKRAEQFTKETFKKAIEALVNKQRNL